MFRIWPCIVRHRSGSFLRDLRDGFANAFIGTAAAKIATEAAANVLGRGMRMRIEKCFARDDKSGRAETALRGVIFNKGLLYGMQFPFSHQRFDGCNRLALSLDREHRAGINGLVVDQDSASSALGTIAHAA